MIDRRPCPALRPFIGNLWATDHREAQPGPQVERERVLPTGTMSIAIRITDHPLHLYQSPVDPIGSTVGHMVIGGARAEPYIKDVSEPASTVGAQLLPGTAELLLGVPAVELAGRHTRLDDLWGQPAHEMRERLAAVEDLAQRLDLFEAMLLQRLPRVRGVHPAVAHALARFGGGAESDVREVVEECGYSHRTFIAMFERAVGLTPKVYCRVLRFQSAVQSVCSEPDVRFVELALESGYSDQPHFAREFRALAGVTPRVYRALSPIYANHVPIT